MTALADTVMIVEDEVLIALGLEMQVEDMGLTVCGMAMSAVEAIAMCQLHRPAVVLMDMRLKGDGDGVDAALAINLSVGSRVIFVTGSREPATIERINLDHPFAVLFKPVSQAQLADTIAAARRASGLGL